MGTSQAESPLAYFVFWCKKGFSKNIFFMKHLRHVFQFFSPPRLSTAGFPSRVEEDEVFSEVFGILSEYRTRRNTEHAIFVETAIPLSFESKQEIRRELRAPEHTQIIECLNYSLGSSFQVIYENQIYVFRDSNRLDRLKSFLIQI